jgi:hypothetical protein
MKRFLGLIAFISLFAQEETPSYWSFHPLHGGGNVIAIGKANVEPKHQSQEGELTFNKTNAFLYMILPVNRTSFFLPRVEWNAFTLDWNENPKFNKKHLQFMQFGLTFLTIGLDKWRWVARGDYNIDIDHFQHGSTYGLYSALLWGTHEVHEQWHIHIGTFGYTGFEGQEVYPIVGLDYAPTPKWMFQVVFPITYTIDYNFTKEWKLSLKGRPLKERFRTGKDEPQPRSVFSYSSIGAELNLHYEKFLRCEFELYAGYNFGGSFYIKNSSGHNSLYTHVQGAPYGGATLNWGF